MTGQPVIATGSQRNLNTPSNASNASNDNQAIYLAALERVPAPLTGRAKLKQTLRDSCCLFKLARIEAYRFLPHKPDVHINRSQLRGPTGLGAQVEHRLLTTQGLPQLDRTERIALQARLQQLSIVSLDYLRATQAKNSHQQQHLLKQIVLLLGHDKLGLYCLQACQQPMQTLRSFDIKGRNIPMPIANLLQDFSTSKLNRYSQQLSLKDQQRLIRQLNCFPSRQLGILKKAANQFITKANATPLVAELLQALNAPEAQTPLYISPASSSNSSPMGSSSPARPASASSHTHSTTSNSSIELLGNSLTLAQAIAQLIDQVERTAYDHDPSLRQTNHSQAFAACQKALAKNSACLTVLDQILLACTPGNAEHLVEFPEITKILPPEILKNLQTNMRSFTQRHPLEIAFAQTMLARLPVHKRLQLLSALPLHVSAAPELVHALLDKLKTSLSAHKTAGLSQIQPYHQGFEQAAIAEFGLGLLGCQSGEEVKQLLLQPKSLSLFRDLTCQEDFGAAFNSFLKLLPSSFEVNLQQLRQEFSLDRLAATGKAIVPHLDDHQLTMLVERLPSHGLEVALSKKQELLRFLGYENNNVSQGLADRANEMQQALSSTLVKKGELLQRCLESSESFLEFIDASGVLTAEPTIANKQRLALLFDHQALSTLLATVAPADRKQFILEDQACLAQCNRLLEAMLPKSDQHGLRPGTVLNELQAIAQQLSQLQTQQEIARTAAAMFPADLQQGIPLHSRQQLVEHCLEAIATPQIGAIMTKTQQIDELWTTTQLLINASDRTITKRDPLTQNPILFMEDGSCVDDQGQQLAKGDPRNIQLRARFNLDTDWQAAQHQCQQALKQSIRQVWPGMMAVLSCHSSRASMSELLEQAMLPKDLQTLMLNLFDQLLPPDLRESAAGQAIVKSLQHLPNHLVDQLIHHIPDALLSRFGDATTDLLNNLDPYKQMPFFQHFTKQLVASLTDNKVVQSVADVLTKNYFTSICHADRRALAHAILSVGCPQLDQQGQITEHSMTKLIGAMTQAGGPGFQKAMQLFKNDIHHPSIRRALDAMNSDIAPLPRQQVKQLIETQLQALGSPSRWQLVDPSSYQPGTRDQHAKTLWPSQQQIRDRQLSCLGSATIAQTHEAYLWPCDSHGTIDKTKPPVHVALKIQRPDIAHRIKREMSAVSNIPKLSTSVARTLQELERSIVDETDFRREFQFSNLMRQLYKGPDPRDQSIQVVTMLDANEKLLIQDFVKGCSIDSTWASMSNRYTLQFIDETQLQNQLPYQATHTPRLEVVLHQNNPQYLRIVHGDQAQTVNLNTQPFAQHQLNRHYRLFRGQGNQVQDEKLINLLQQHQVVPTLLGQADIHKQAQFLQHSGTRLEQLTGKFAKAAFIGLPNSSYTLQWQQVPPSKANQRCNQVYLQQTGHDWTLHSFDATGQQQHAWSSQDLGQTPEFSALQTALQKLNSKQKRLSVVQEGTLTPLIRAATRNAVLFQGEGFIDSDRHDGNLLIDPLDPNLQQLTCIDTGAGTIITRQQRYGMLKLAASLASTNVDLLLNGLGDLIPDLSEITKGRERDLRQALKECLNGQQQQAEQQTELYQFLLAQGLVDIDVDEHQFFHQLHYDPEFTNLKREVFNFAKPSQAAQSLQSYVRYQHGTDQTWHDLNHSNRLNQALQAFVGKLNYGRVLATNSAQKINPSHWLTDGHNSLLMLKTVRKIANILNAQNIYAPESIIQLNRATKFLEDQIKTNNFRKLTLAQHVRSRDDHTPQNELNPNQSRALHAKLTPIHLGEAYVKGLFGGQIALDVANALGWQSVNATFSFVQERVLSLFR